LSCLIIKFHGFIQFIFNEITSVSKLGCRFCMLTRGDRGGFLQYFLDYIYILFNFVLRYLICWKLNFNLSFLLLFFFYEVIAFLFFFLVCCQIIISFNICFFERKKWFVISILSFNIWLIDNWFSCFPFYRVIVWLRG